MIENNVSEFISEVEQEIERIGITAGSVAMIAKEHGLSDPGAYYSIPGYENLFFLWNITEEAANAFKDLLARREDFTAKICDMLLVIMCGGPIPVNMPMAKKVYSYKKEHWLPVYFDKKRVSHS